MSATTVPETLKSLQLAMTAAESKIITFISCTANHDGVDDVSTELSTVTSGCNRPVVAKFLVSKQDDTTSCRDAVKGDHKETEYSIPKDIKSFEGTSLQRAGSCDIPQKQRMGGFVPAWRRKSLDDINRIKSEKKGR